MARAGPWRAGVPVRPRGQPGKVELLSCVCWPGRATSSRLLSHARQLLWQSWPLGVEGLIWPLSSLGEACSSTGFTWAGREAVVGPGQATTEAKGRRAWWASAQAAAAFGGQRERNGGPTREQGEGRALWTLPGERVRNSSSKTPSHTDAHRVRKLFLRHFCGAQGPGPADPGEQTPLGWPLFCEAATLIDLCSFSRQ